MASAPRGDRVSIPPPPPELILASLRATIEQGPFNGAIMLGYDDGYEVVDPDEEMRDELALMEVLIEAGVIPRPSWVVVAADTYHLAIDIKEGDVVEPQHGDLATRFAQGDPSVGEQIIVTCLCPDGPSYDWGQSYTRNEDGIEWAKPEQIPHTATSEGVLPDLMRKLVGM